MGTFLELANCSLDILSHLVARPGAQAIIPSNASTRPSERPLDVNQAIRVIMRNLEVVMFYGSTQLGAWLAQGDLADGGGGGGGEGDRGEMEMDIEGGEGGGVGSVNGGSILGGKDGKRSRRRESMGAVGRLRRGMTGEMGVELRTMIEKARPVLEKGRSVVDGKGNAGGGPSSKTVDVTKVLIGILNERVVGRG